MNEENALPSGWVNSQLSFIGTWGSGGTPKRTNPDYYDGDIPWLVIGDLNDSIVLSSKNRITKEGLNNSSAKLVDENVLLIAMYGSIGKLGITGFKCATNQAIAFCKEDSDLIVKKFLFYFLMSSRKNLLSLGKGGAQQNISQTVLKAYPITLPPLNEQKRIADKLDSLLAKVDAVNARLDSIPTLLKRFRQSVLAAATSGELTKEWRSDFGQAWGSQQLSDIVTKIEAGKNIKCIETPPLKDEVGIVKISAVTWGVFQENESKTLPDKSLFLEHRRVKAGDFLISRANTIELIGTPVIVKEITKNLMLSDKVLRLVMPDNQKEWVNYFLRSPLGRKEIKSRSTGNQQSMRNIAQKALLNIPIPIVEESEQKEIVRRVETLFALADHVEQQYTAAKARTDKLTQALLAKAFRGELVPQDPADEPASELLARIQAERDALAKAEKQRKAAARAAKKKKA